MFVFSTGYNSLLSLFILLLILSQSQSLRPLTLAPIFLDAPYHFVNNTLHSGILYFNPAPALESAICPKSPGSFLPEHSFRY